MAEVFAGQALGSHGFAKPVAIKRLLAKHANDLAYVDRLIDEANLLVAMQHGNVVSVMDLVREGEDVFLVMEFVDGPSLRQLLHSRGPRCPLPLGVATYVVQAAATGLEFAHARPGGAIIHADISPSNLLLTTSGEVKVADFGIARREGVGTGGVVEGKWAYMAPEQARGETLTVRADVFALGVVLYELVTGIHPFSRRATAGGRDGYAALAVVPPRAVRPELPVELEALCLRAIAHDPHQRLATMQQLVDAVNELRFANGWRDGAAELGQAIRDVRPGRGAAPRAPAERSVTILTRSLLGPSERAPNPPPPIPAGAEAADAGALVLAAGTDRRVIERAPATVAATAAIETTPVTGAGRRPRPAIAGIVLAAVAAFGVIAAFTWHVLADDAAPIAAASAQPGLPPVDRHAGPELTVEPIEPPPVVARSATPEAPGVATTEASAATPTDAPAATPPPPTGGHALVPTLTRPSRTAKKPVSRAARTPVTKAVVATREPATGTLRISSVPWAYVTVNGQTYETPVSGLKLEPGQYVIKLHSPDTGLRDVRKVTIEAGKTETLAINLGGRP